MFTQQVEKNKPVRPQKVQALLWLYRIIKIHKAAQLLFPMFRIPKGKFIMPNFHQDESTRSNLQLKSVFATFEINSSDNIYAYLAVTHPCEYYRNFLIRYL